MKNGGCILQPHRNGHRPPLEEVTTNQVGPRLAIFSQRAHDFFGHFA